MYLYADQLPEGTVLQGFDLCVVGAGAAGIAMAQRLANSSLTVILLVSGGPGDKATPDRDRQSLYYGTTGNFLRKVDPVFLQRSRLNMYGGTTNHLDSGRVHWTLSTSSPDPVSALAPGPSHSTN